MIILRFFRLFNGYLRVSVGKDCAERVLNTCAKNGIGVWGIAKREQTVRFNILKSDYFNLFLLRENFHARLLIIRKTGLPFIICRYRKRYGIALGIAMYLLLIMFLSTRVWFVGVTGNERIPKETILSVCQSIGIKEGKSLKSINTSTAKLRLLNSSNGLAWAAVNLEGCCVFIDVTETANTKTEKDNSPSNLCAAEDGVIVRNEVTSGTIIKKVGDIVTRGEILVSGDVTLKNDISYQTQSGGKVFAECTENYTVTVPKSQKIKTVSGSDNYKLLSVFGINIPLFLDKINGDVYKTTDYFTISNGRNYIPLKIYNINIKKIKNRTVEISPETAEELAEKKISKLLFDCEIENKNREFSEDEENYYFKYSFLVVKNIAYEEKIANLSVN